MDRTEYNERRREISARHRAKLRAEGRVAESNRRWREAHPARYLLAQARQRARRTGIPFAISEADILIPEVCPVFGTPFEMGTNGDNDRSPSLDRRIPALGYVPGNVAVISWKANRLKLDASVDELRKIVHWLEETDPCMMSLS